MKHFQKARKLGRMTDQRRALMKSLASSFFLYGKIRTTEAKAKEIRPLVEKWITRGKNPTLASRRMLGRVFPPPLIKKIEMYAVQAIDRNGGYTRITKLGRRKSDDAPMAVLEVVK